MKDEILDLIPKTSMPVVNSLTQAFDPLKAPTYKPIETQELDIPLLSNQQSPRPDKPVEIDYKAISDQVLKDISTDSKRDERYNPTQYLSFTDRYAGMTLDPVSVQNLNEVEFAAAESQPWYKSMFNDLKVGGVNAGAMFATTFTSVYDMLKEQSLMASPDSYTAKIGEWRNQYEADNFNFQSRKQADSPILSMFTTTNGWGELFKSTMYGVGAGAGIVAQSAIATALTGGTGTVPTIASGIKNAIYSTNTIKGVTAALNASKLASGSLATKATIANAGTLAKGLTAHYIGAYGEAAFEGLESKQHLTGKYIQDFYNKNGYLPEEEELAKYEEITNKAFDTRFALNATMLMATNFAFVSSMLKKHRSIMNGMEEARKYNLGYVVNEGTTIASKLSPKVSVDPNIKGLIPKTLNTVNGKVLPAVKKLVGSNAITWSEGLEEVYQHLVGTSTDNYYSNLLEKGSNDKVDDIISNNALGMMKQLWKDRGEVFSEEGVKSFISGVVSGTGQQKFSDIYNRYSLGRDKDGKRILIDKKKEEEKDYLKKSEEIAEQVDDTLGMLLSSVAIPSIGGTSPSEQANTIKGLTSIINKQNTSTQEFNTEFLRSQAAFMTAYKNIELGSLDVVEKLIETDLSEMSLDEFNLYLNKKGIDNITTEQEKKSTISEIKQTLYDIKDAVHKVNLVFRNPYSNKDKEQYFVFQELKRLTSYHEFMAQRTRGLADQFRQNSSHTANDPLLIEALSKTQNYKERSSLLTSIKDQLKQFDPIDTIDENGKPAKQVQELTEEAKVLKEKLENKLDLLLKFDSLKIDELVDAVRVIKDLDTLPIDLNDLQNAIAIARIEDTFTTHANLVPKFLNSKPGPDQLNLYIDYVHEGQLYNQELQSLKTEALKQKSVEDVNTLTELEDDALKKKALEEVIIKGKTPEKAVEEAKLQKQQNPDSTIPELTLVRSNIIEQIDKGVIKKNAKLLRDGIEITVKNVDKSKSIIQISVPINGISQQDLIEIDFSNEDTGGRAYYRPSTVATIIPTKRASIHDRIHSILAEKDEDRDEYVESSDNYSAEVKKLIDNYRKHLDNGLLEEADLKEALKGYEVLHKLNQALNKNATAKNITDLRKEPKEETPPVLPPQPSSGGNWVESKTLKGTDNDGAEYSTLASKLFLGLFTFEPQGSSHNFKLGQEGLQLYRRFDKDPEFGDLVRRILNKVKEKQAELTYKIFQKNPVKKGKVGNFTSFGTENYKLIYVDQENTINGLDYTISLNSKDFINETDQIELGLYHLKNPIAFKIKNEVLDKLYGDNKLNKEEVEKGLNLKDKSSRTPFENENESTSLLSIAEYLLNRSDVESENVKNAIDDFIRDIFGNVPEPKKYLQQISDYNKAFKLYEKDFKTWYDNQEGELDTMSSDFPSLEKYFIFDYVEANIRNSENYIPLTEHKYPIIEIEDVYGNKEQLKNVIYFYGEWWSENTDGRIEGLSISQYPTLAKLFQQKGASRDSAFVVTQTKSTEGVINYNTMYINKNEAVASEAYDTLYNLLQKNPDGNIKSYKKDGYNFSKERKEFFKLFNINFKDSIGPSQLRFNINKINENVFHFTIDFLEGNKSSYRFEIHKDLNEIKAFDKSGRELSKNEYSFYKVGRDLNDDGSLNISNIRVNDYTKLNYKASLVPRKDLGIQVITEPITEQEEVIIQNNGEVLLEPKPEDKEPPKPSKLGVLNRFYLHNNFIEHVLDVDLDKLKEFIDEKQEELKTMNLKKELNSEFLIQEKIDGRTLKKVLDFLMKKYPKELPSNKVIYSSNKYNPISFRDLSFIVQDLENEVQRYIDKCSN